jgi:galactokinase/mevalonate kinase-like predicted kinase
VSGSQDSLGIVLPGLNRLFYDGDYWPSRIESILDNQLLAWIEERLWLLPLYPRQNDYDVLTHTRISASGAQRLSNAANECWQAIRAMDIQRFGAAVRNSFEAQIEMYPQMVTSDIPAVIDAHRSHSFGWKLSGAGGGGYLIFVGETPIENAIQIRIRRGE